MAFRALPDLDLDLSQDAEDFSLDPTVQSGTLKNGVRYFIKPCPKPEQRAALHLAVGVGSLVETEEERGLAHMVEHLAFNATAEYTNHDIVKFLESIGAEFGPCQNAFTSFDETVYQLVVPTDKEEILAKAAHVLGQFMFSIRCAAEDIAKERGAVMEELRACHDAVGRMSHSHWRTLLQGSLYADRLPIGLESVIKIADAATVKGFYERWYKPANMCVVATGDFGPPGVEHLISLLEEHIGGGSPRDPSPPCPVPRHDFQPHDTPRLCVYADKELQSSHVYCTFKAPRACIRTPADYKAHLAHNLFHACFNTRLYKLAKSGAPPFHAGEVGVEPVNRTCSTFRLSLTALEGRCGQALQAALLELARVRVHGFSARELAIAAKEMLSDIETMWLERDQTYASDAADELVRHFLTGEVVVGEEREALISKTLIPKVTLAEVQSVAGYYRPSHNCTLKVVEHRKHVTESGLREMLEAVSRAEEAGATELAPWAEEELPEGIVLEGELPAAGTVVETREYPEIGASEMVLSNGLRLCVKPTNFLEDQVMLTGFAAGGLTEVSREHFRSASVAGLLAGELGAFGHKSSVMADLTAGLRVEVSPAEGAYWRSFSGEQSPLDLEATFQLIHKLFTTSVQHDEAELAPIMRMSRQSVAAQHRNPMYRYHNHVRAVNYGNCHYFQPLTPREFARVDPATACAHFNASYADPRAFTVCLTGNLSGTDVSALACKYLGCIPPPPDAPPTLRPSQLTPLQFEFPEAPVVEEVGAAMVMPTTQTQITFPVQLSLADGKGPQEGWWVGLLCKALETRLMHTLRFKYGEIYSCSVAPFFGAESPGRQDQLRGDVAITFSCDPARHADLAELALRELEALQEAGPTAQEVSTSKELEGRGHETDILENTFWHDQLVAGYKSRAYEKHGDLERAYRIKMDARSTVRDEMSPETARDAFRRLFPYPCRSRYTHITLVPRPGILAQCVSAAQMAWEGENSQYIMLAGVAAGIAGVTAALLYRQSRS